MHPLEQPINGKWCDVFVRGAMVALFMTSSILAPTAASTAIGSGAVAAETVGISVTDVTSPRRAPGTRLRSFTCTVNNNHQ
jgi:hypothetical protein